MLGSYIYRLLEQCPVLIPVEMITVLSRVRGWLLDAQLQMGHLSLDPQGSGKLYHRREDTKDLRRYRILWNSVLGA